MTTIDLSRREFVRAGVTGAAGLTIAIHLPACAAPGDRAPAPTPFRPNAWLRVGTDGSVVVVVDKSEMGQGVLTSLPQMIMEELDAINVSLQEKGWLLSFLGTVALGLGKDGEAEGLFKEALLQDANDTSAKRQLRLIRTRRKRKNNRGFFAKLFGK